MDEQRALTVWIGRLARNTRLSSVEKEALAGLPVGKAMFKAQRHLYRGQAPSAAHIVLSGLVGRYRQGADGARQMTAIYLPGEACDLQAAVQSPQRPAEIALVDTACLEIPLTDLTALADRFPAIAKALWRECAIVSEISFEWLFVVGRQQAVARLAHFLCELGCRFEQAGHSRYEFPTLMSQEMIGDVIGLTPVHVNRMFRELRDRNLVSASRSQVTVHDWPTLARLGDFDVRYLEPLMGKITDEAG